MKSIRLLSFIVVLSVFNFTKADDAAWDGGSSKAVIPARTLHDADVLAALKSGLTESEQQEVADVGSDNHETNVQIASNELGSDPTVMVWGALTNANGKETSIRTAIPCPLSQAPEVARALRLKLGPGAISGVQ